MSTKPIIRTWLNYKPHLAHNFEETLGVSLTVPDMSHSIQDILTRFRKGLPVNQTMPVYMTEELPDLRRLDRVDIDELRAQADDHVFNLTELRKKQIKEDAAAKKAAAATAKENEQKALDSRIKELASLHGK